MAEHQQQQQDQDATTMANIIDHKLPYYSHNTYDAFFGGVSILTTVTHAPSVVSTWIYDIEALHRHRLNSLIVGLDIEWRASFTKLQNPAATLQLCVGRRCLIYQFMYTPFIPSDLVDFLSNPNYTFVGVGIKSDIEKLQKDYGIGFNMRFVDLRNLAAERNENRDLIQAGLKRLSMEVLGKEMAKPKKVTMSNWDNRRLTLAQVHYACVDAFVSFEIGRVLNASSRDCLFD